MLAVVSLLDKFHFLFELNSLAILEDEDEEKPHEHLITNELLKDPEDLDLEFTDEFHRHLFDFDKNLILKLDWN